MFHAVIQSDRTALHLIGEVEPYNLQTLRLYLRPTAHEPGPRRVDVTLDQEDQAVFNKHLRRWLPALTSAGTVVLVHVTPSGPSARPGPPLRAANLGSRETNRPRSGTAKIHAVG